MTNEAYRALCARPDVLPRPVLRATAVRLASAHPELASAVQRLLAGAPVAKPPPHVGGPETDHFSIDLPDDQVDAVAEALFQLETDLAVADEPPPGALRTAADLADRWNAIGMFRRDVV